MGRTLRVKMLSFGYGMTMVAVGMVLAVEPLCVTETGVDAAPVFR